ncbi:MAG: zinc ribbon domain-containing protein [Thermoplasmata archaeon]
MSATTTEPNVPSPLVTHPDQIPVDAWRAFDLFEGELLLGAWRTSRGFLLLTNLRCLALYRRGEIFPPHPWRVGPEFFFYNLRPPEVVLGRFVELTEAFEENGRVGRFTVRDPTSVADAISAAIEPGRAAWQERRKHTEELIEARKRLRAARAAGDLRRIEKVRCSYCGNLTDASVRRCTSCGAGLG